MICRQGVAVGEGEWGDLGLVDTNLKRLTAPNEEGVKDREVSCSTFIAKIKSTILSAHLYLT